MNAQEIAALDAKIEPDERLALLQQQLRVYSRFW